MKKIALGTVQFGMVYGVNNQVGRPSRKEIFNILEFACQNGIDTLDTAYEYGESEQIIGDFISQSGKRFDVISKLPDLNNGDTSEADRYLRETLARLNQDKIYGYLIHKFENIRTYKHLWDRLELLKEKGLISKIGVSIYKVEELEYLLSNNIHFDIIQAPYNIFDQRFEEYFEVLRKKSIEIHTRSVFLQGLFFLRKSEIDKNFQSAKKPIEKLESVSINYKIPIHALCLCFSLLNPFIDKVIIGVDSIEQLKQNIDSLKYMDEAKSIYSILQSLRFHNEKIIFPYHWTGLQKEIS